MASIRLRLLRAIAARGPIGDSVELTLDAGTDQHNLIHVLYGLNRLGLVRFRINKSGRRQHVQHVAITEPGLLELERLEGQE